MGTSLSLPPQHSVSPAVPFLNAAIRDVCSTLAEGICQWRQYVEHRDAKYPHAEFHLSTGSKLGVDSSPCMRPGSLCRFLPGRRVRHAVSRVPIADSVPGGHHKVADDLFGQLICSNLSHQQFLEPADDIQDNPLDDKMQATELTLTWPKCCTSLDQAAGKPSLLVDQLRAQCAGGCGASRKRCGTRAAEADVDQAPPSEDHSGCPGTSNTEGSGPPTH